MLFEIEIRLKRDHNCPDSSSKTFKVMIVFDIFRKERELFEMNSNGKTDDKVTLFQRAILDYSKKKITTDTRIQLKRL